VWEVGKPGVGAHVGVRYCVTGEQGADVDLVPCFSEAVMVMMVVMMMDDDDEATSVSKCV